MMEADVASRPTPHSQEAAGIGEFLASHGGPFFELQRKMNLLRERALHVRRRAILFVGLAWGVPLVLSLVQGRAIASPDGDPYLLDLAVWARFFIAIGLFVLSEEQVEKRLRSNLAQFVRAPLLDPSSYGSAAAAVVTALRRRNSRQAEIMCLVLAYVGSIGTYLRFEGAEISGWAVSASTAGSAFTAAGWWALLVSGPLFAFLLLRGIWRHVVWALLLRRIASLKLRLVATHPDGKGGLAFVAAYPNAYASFVLGASCVVAVALARTVFEDGVSSQVFTGVLLVWLLIVLALFAFGLQAFAKPLSELKERSLMLYGAEATRFFRAEERKNLGINAVASGEGQVGEREPSDPSKSYVAAKKLSSILLSRSAIVPLTVAALVPFCIVGVTRLPVKEVISTLKKLVLL